MYEIFKSQMLVGCNSRAVNILVTSVRSNYPLLILYVRYGNRELGFIIKMIGDIFSVGEITYIISSAGQR